MSIHSDYFIKVITPFVILFDLNLGNKSVTNDMENIIKKLEQRFKLNLDIYSFSGNGMSLIYRDSDGDYARVGVNENGIVFDTYPGESFERLGRMFLDSLYNEAE